MKRKTLRTFAAILIIVTVSVPLRAVATSYMPFFHRQDRGDMALIAGQTAYLFHSGTNDVKKSIRANDILVVYRITPACEVREAGKIMATAYVGETYLKGEVVEGEIRPDDIAKKGSVSCLVISAGMCQK